MSGFGAPELLILLLIVVGFLVPVGFAIYVVVDASRRPKEVWSAAGQTQALWIVLPLVLLFVCGIGSLIASVVYLASVRPQLEAIAPTAE